MPRLAVRNATPGDEALVLGLLRSAAQWLRLRNIDYWQNWLNPPAQHLHWIDQGFEKGEFFLALLDAQVVGCFRLQWSDEMFWGKKTDHAGYIHSLAISRAMAGRGLGRMVIGLIEALCLEHGASVLRLDCGAEIVGLRRYYESTGFFDVGEAVVGGERLTLYEKPLR